MMLIIYHGHVLEMLRLLPAESVHCVVTSPPYWGLRDYGLEPVIWDDDPFCEHEWGAEVPGSRRGGSGPGGKHGVGERYGGDCSRGVWCQLCGAWLGQLGLEPTVDLYVQHIVEVFREVRRVLRKDGTLWLNIADSYAADHRFRSPNGADRIGNGFGKHGTWHGGELVRAKSGGRLKPKDRCGIPERVALALQADEWWWRDEIVWHKPSAMPSSVQDRTTPAHEKIYLLAKAERYFYDNVAVQEEAVCEHPSGNGYARPEQLARGGRGNAEPWIPRSRVSFNRATKEAVVPASRCLQHRLGREDREPSRMRNLRSVWTINTQPFPEAHFATFPAAIPERCIRAGTSEIGVCARCGKPWARISKKGQLAGEAVIQETTRPSNEARGVSPSSALRTNGRTFRPTKTLGWRKACKCDTEEVVPATVLDPFHGAGTTSLVAARLGRSGIGVELNPSYVQLSRKRIEEDAPLFNEVHVVAGK